MSSLDWEAKILEKGRLTIPRDLRVRLNLKKGDKVRFSLDRGKIRLIVPGLDENLVERTRGVLKEIEPELSVEELEEDFLRAMASKVKTEEEG